jgi:hypothetical protein
MIHLETLRRIRRALQCADPTCKCHDQLGEEECYEWYPTHCPLRGHADEGPRLWLKAGANLLCISCTGSCGGRVRIEVSDSSGHQLLWHMQEIEWEALMKEPLPKGLGKGREV